MAQKLILRFTNCGESRHWVATGGDTRNVETKERIGGELRFELAPEP